jgi:1-acyl-sn-glycerol-3-phosphate acyltransferase
MLTKLVAALVAAGAKAITGAQCQWLGCGPYDRQRIYFANHSSHLDFVLLWSALPRNLRRRTRPVAAADYWFQGSLRQYLMKDVFHGVALERHPKQMAANPLQPMIDALDAGASLILFPEGTRGDGEGLGDFKPGIYYLAASHPDVEMVPVWIENGYRVMPKGSYFPVPLLCSVRFGVPMKLQAGEPRALFLARIKNAVGELARL